MQNKAQVLLDESMANCVIEEFNIGGIDYVTEIRVLDNGDIVTAITFDGCDPFVGNYLFHAGAKYVKNAMKF